MTLIVRYASHLGLWTVGTTLFLFATGFSGSGPWSVWGRLPALAGFALILACFPAGLSTGADALATPRRFLREGLELTLAAVVVIVISFVVLQYVAPRALAANRTEPSEAAEPREMTFPELRDYLREVVPAAEARSRTDLEAWRIANTAVFEHERRLAHSSLPFFFTWLGILGGFWARRIEHRQARLAHLLLFGFVLLVATYFAGENGYELVAARMAGQAYFAAWFIVIVPGALGLGLGWPTLVTLFAQAAPGAEPGTRE